MGLHRDPSSFTGAGLPQVLPFFFCLSSSSVSYSFVFHSFLKKKERKGKKKKPRKLPRSFLEKPLQARVSSISAPLFSTPHSLPASPLRSIPLNVSENICLSFGCTLDDNSQRCAVISSSSQFSFYYFRPLSPGLQICNQFISRSCIIWFPFQ